MKIKKTLKTKSKKYLLVITFNILFSNHIQAEEKSSLNNIGTVIEMIKDGTIIINEMDKYIKRQEKTKIIYKDRIIYKAPEKDTSLEKNLAENQRKLAWEKAKDKEHEKAILLYEKALKHDANEWKIWHGYAYSLLKLKKYKKAEHAYQIAIELGGNDETWRYRGWNFEQNKDQENAKICYKKALSINPSNKKAQLAFNSLLD